MLSLCPQQLHSSPCVGGQLLDRSPVLPQAAAPVQPHSRLLISQEHQFPHCEMGLSNCEGVKVSGLPAMRSYYSLTLISPPQATLEVSS